MTITHFYRRMVGEDTHAVARFLFGGGAEVLFVAVVRLDTVVVAARASPLPVSRGGFFA